MLSWLLRTALGIVVTPTEVERFRCWAYKTAAAQAITQAHAQGYRAGFIAGTDDASLHRADRR